MAEIDILRDYGEDLLGNFFEVSISPFPGVTSIEQLNFRILTFDVPDQAIGTYQIDKRGRSFTRPSGAYEQGNEFSFTYRVSKYLTHYKSISAWLAYIKDPKTSAMASDSGPLGQGGPSLFRVPVTVFSKDTNNNLLAQWDFDGTFPISQGGVSFDESSGDPLVASVTMNYMGITYPQP